ncbi:MAG: hypothetical protein M1834_003062 [Cirrosporium novae-zelandiae]|nr:MAG: hypothetical protein M1834_003062 [Cirrosporium novae-zelandiae]
MVRSSKLLFPLPGRRPSAQSFETSIGESEFEQSVDGDHVKASSASIRTKASWRSGISRHKKSKAEKPHYNISLPLRDNVSEIDLDRSSFRGSISRNHRPPIPASQSAQHLLPRPSSPLLGQRYKDGPTAGNKAERLLGRQLHHFGSESTLQSHYDPDKVPPSISQQTSASAARDMALRKGMPKLFPPPSKPPRQPLPTPKTSKLQRLTGEQHPGTCDEKLKKKPARLDISSLFPKPTKAGGALLSPTRIVSSPTALSMVSKQQSPPLAPADWKSKSTAIREETNSTQNQGPPSLRLSPVDSFSFKINTYKPKPGIRNWFDGFDDAAPGTDEQERSNKPRESAHAKQNSIRGLRPPEVDTKPNSRANYRKPQPDVQDWFGDIENVEGGEMDELDFFKLPPRHTPEVPVQNQQQRNLSKPANQDLTKSRHQSRERGERLSPTPVHPGNPNLRASIKAWEETSVGSGRTSRTAESLQSKRSVYDRTSKNINNTSVLILSSSDDEEEEEGDSVSNIESNSSLNNADQSRRESSATTTTTASTIRDVSRRGGSIKSAVSPRTPIANTRVPRRGSRSASSSQFQPNGPYPSENRPPWNGRSSILSTAPTCPLPPLPPNSGRSSSAGYRSASRLSNLSQESSRGRLYDSPSSGPDPSAGTARLMAVTEEEETLLEAMRQKRARMRENGFVEGYKTALRNNSKQYLPQSRTDSDDEPSSQRDTPSPLPSSRRKYSHGSSSINDFGLAYDRNSTFSDHSFDTSSRYLTISSKASVMNSDTAPSPEPSIASPLTPPPSDPIDRRRQYGQAQPEIDYDMTIGSKSDSKIHTRSRTASSSIVVMDETANTRIFRSDEDEDFPVWIRHV